MAPIFIKFIGIIIFNGAANKLYPYNKKLLKIHMLYLMLKVKKQMATMAK